MSEKDITEIKFVEQEKEFTVDTNVLRHESNPGDQELEKAARLFWKHMKMAVENDDVSIYVPAEVVRELEVQSFNLSPSQNRRIQKLLTLCETIDLESHHLVEIEHLIRKMASYIKAKYDLKQDFKANYPGTSDARILLTAYLLESVLVTANVKDFTIYPLLFEYNQDSLLNLKTNDYIRIPKDIHKAIHSDKDFLSMLNDFYNLASKVQYILMPL